MLSGQYGIGNKGGSIREIVRPCKAHCPLTMAEKITGTGTGTGVYNKCLRIVCEGSTRPLGGHALLSGLGCK